MNKIITAAVTGNWRHFFDSITGDTNLNIQDKDGRTPLINAVQQNREDIVETLIRMSVDINLQDVNGYSALHFVAQNYSPTIAEMLVKNGAIVDQQDTYGNTPLFRAVFNSKGRGEVIKVLLDFGADRNLANKYGITPLALAKTIANYDVSQFIN